MKNSLSLVLAILLFVVLGCSLLGKKQEKIDTPTPSANSTTPTGSGTPNKTVSGADGLTIEKFNEIKNGMTYEEVVKVLGSSGTETRSSEIAKIKIVSYKWEGEKFKRVFASFRDNKLTSKSQTGLSGASNSKEGDSDISMDKYNQIKNGMKYEEVVKIIGSEGNESSSSKAGDFELKTYIWKGANYSSIYATFRNNELSSKSQAGLK